MRSLLPRLQDAALRRYRSARHFKEWLIWDRRQVLHTGHHVSLESLGLQHPDRVQYEPTRWNVLRTLLPKSDVRPGDVFIDFGSGMGRAVQQAAAYPFARVIGVEISEELNQIARQNFERNRKRFVCQEAEFVTSDATEFEVPDELTHAYFFNPFRGETFRKVLQNIIASIDRNPRRVVLIYHLPNEKQAVEESGRFRLIRERKTGRTLTARVYESTSQWVGLEEAVSILTPETKLPRNGRSFRRRVEASHPARSRVRTLMGGQLVARLKRFVGRSSPADLA
jgi:precorrin-6B methylase 2